MSYLRENRSGARRRSRLVVIAVATAMLVFAAGCGSSSSTSRGSGDTSSATIGDEGTPLDGGSLVWGLPIETDGWNPHYNTWSLSGTLTGSSVLEPLAGYAADLSAKPWLAESWTPNATFDAWTLKLREGVVFQDGEPFDADAVKANMDDVSSGPVSGVALKELFKSTTVIDPHTVQIDLTQPWAAFPSSFLAGQSAFQMAPAMLASADHGSTHPIGTGPFTFASWTPGSPFEALKNPTYWQAGLPHLDSLRFTVLSDPTSRTAALQSGDIDVMVSSSARDVAGLGDQYTVIKSWNSEPGMIITNTIPEVNGSPNPLNDIHARKALAYATDRAALAALAGEGIQSGTAPFPSDGPWGMPQDQDGHLDFDLDAAKQQVEQYKADTGASSLKIDLIGAADSDTVQVLQTLQSQWSQAGIQANITTVEAASLISQVINGGYQAVMFPIYSSLDPDQNHYFWSKATANGTDGISINFSQFYNDATERDLEVGRTSADHDTRKAAYDDLAEQINEAAVNIWTFNTPYSIVADKDVHGFRGATEVPFPNFSPKTWFGDLWVSH